MMKRVGSLIFVCILVAGPAFAGGRIGQSAAPRLFEPNDKADLSGKTEILFRWGTEGDRSKISDYQFKVYKGTQTVESGLMKDMTVPASQDRITLPVDLFENGQTYVWQLRGTGSGKTRPSYTVFKVIK